MLKDKNKCPPGVSCTIASPEDYPGMCDKCRLEASGASVGDAAEYHAPKICRTCEYAGHIIDDDQKKMFICGYREWAPRHWLMLLCGSGCSKFKRDRLIRKKP